MPIDGLPLLGDRGRLARIVRRPAEQIERVSRFFSAWTSTPGCALGGTLMAATGTVALLLPVVGTIAARRGIAPSRLLMPLAFAAHLGSNLTLISTPPNLIVSDALRGAGAEPFRFFSFLVPIWSLSFATEALGGERESGSMIWLLTR